MATRGAVACPLTPPLAAVVIIGKSGQSGTMAESGRSRLRDEVADFHAAALAYCPSVENEAVEPRAVLRNLVRLVDAALGVPAVKPSAVDHEKDPPGLAGASKAVQANVEKALHPADWYQMYFHPLNAAEPVPCTGSLSEDLAEIYEEVRRGLHLASIGAEEDAAWYWRLMFEGHWGRHATQAIVALHDLLVFS